MNDDIDSDSMIHDILVQDCCEVGARDTFALPTWQLSHPGEALGVDQGEGGGGGGHQDAHPSPGQGHQGDEEAGVW